MASPEYVVLSGGSAVIGSPASVMAPADTLLSANLLVGANALVKSVGASAVAQGIPTWAVGLVISIGMVYFYAGHLYQALQNHTTTPVTVPITSPTFWKVL
jgi:hypothetical protein